jgi:hypothetical protein
MRRPKAAMRKVFMLSDCNVKNVRDTRCTTNGEDLKEGGGGQRG